MARKVRTALERTGPLALAVALTVVAVLLALNASLGNKSIDAAFELAQPAGSEGFARTMSLLLDAPVVEHNDVRLLRNGAEFFPAMLREIAGAKRSITLETYIYWSGDTGRAFAEALAERARAGVAIRVLLDWFGTDLDAARIAQMRTAGVAVRRYNPPRWDNLGRLNNRTHRKLLIVDGRVGFTGGAGIADRWSGDAADPAHWRDDFFRVEGPVVARMQAAFLDNWAEVTGEVIDDASLFPPLASAGSMPAQVFMAAPGGGSASMQLMYLAAIASARHSIRLSMAYFVPDEVALHMLAAAARRGVRVQIILPGTHIDYQFVRRASRARWGPLLDAGVELYEYQGTMYHCKAIVVDDAFASVGSTNFDNRSFVINDEVNLNVYDAHFASALRASFEQDLARTRRVSAEAWHARDFTDRALDRLAVLFRSQL